MSKSGISNQALKRLPIYLNYLKGLPQRPAHVSATAIAGALSLNEVQVRKDLALASRWGRPKVGYPTELLIEDIERFLGYDETNAAVLVGVGNLGKALLSYKGFAQRGLDIVAGFDIQAGTDTPPVGGKQVLPMETLDEVSRRMKILIGIIAVPDKAAQPVCDQLVQAGVRAIWNFAPVALRVPPDVLVQNESMVSSLAVLSRRLSEKLSEEESGR